MEYKIVLSTDSLEFHTLACFMYVTYCTLQFTLRRAMNILVPMINRTHIASCAAMLRIDSAFLTQRRLKDPYLEKVSRQPYVVFENSEHSKTSRSELLCLSRS